MQMCRDAPRGLLDERQDLDQLVQILRSETVERSQHRERRCRLVSDRAMHRSPDSSRSSAASNVQGIICRISTTMQRSRMHFPPLLLLMMTIVSAVALGEREWCLQDAPATTRQAGGGFRCACFISSCLSYRVGKLVM